MEALIVGFGTVVALCAMVFYAVQAKGRDHYFGPADAVVEIMIKSLLAGAAASLVLAMVIVSYGTVLIVPLIFGVLYWYIKDNK